MNEKYLGKGLSAISGLVAGLLEAVFLVYTEIEVAGGIDLLLPLVVILALCSMVPFLPVAGAIGGEIVSSNFRKGIPLKRDLIVGGALGGLAVPWLWLMVFYVCSLVKGCLMTRSPVVVALFIRRVNSALAG